ncbi:hypothetical protein HW35_08215 [Bacillus sp. X1(2014)]|nr:hypothetical protein HW35_08215 [Bacillus sp. X1(2014)]
MHSYLLEKRKPPAQRRMASSQKLNASGRAMLCCRSLPCGALQLRYRKHEETTGDSMLTYRRAESEGVSPLEDWS